jgi:hypothetical protein
MEIGVFCFLARTSYNISMSAWSTRRRFIYLSAVLAFFALIFASLYFSVFYQPPSCTDGTKNQGELDVDCGGPCAKVCVVEVSPLLKHWTRVFRTLDGKYDVASLIENPNFNLGIKRMKYTFKLYDASGLLITDKMGEVFVNARDKFVIFEGGLDTGKKVPIKGVIEFEKAPVWSRVDLNKSKVPPTVVQNKKFTGGTMPRLTAELTNNSIYDLSDMLVTTVIYDSDDNAIAVSQTFVNYIPRGTTQEVAFTWPSPILADRPAIDIYPRVDLVNGAQ